WGCAPRPRAQAAALRSPSGIKARSFRTGACFSGRASSLIAELDGADEELGDVDDLDVLPGLAVGLLGVDGVAEHDVAVGAGGGDDVGAGAEGLGGAGVVDPGAGPLLEPHAGAAGPAAEAAVAAALHLLRARAGQRADELAGRGEHLIVPAEEARVVVGDLLVRLV